MSFKIGDTVKIVKQMGPVQLPLGTILTLKSVDLGGSWSVEENRYWFEVEEFEKLETNLSDLQKEAEQLELKIQEINIKMAWMHRMGINTFDQEEFKIWQAASLIQSQPSVDIRVIRQVKNLLNQK